MKFELFVKLENRTVDMRRMLQTRTRGLRMKHFGPMNAVGHLATRFLEMIWIRLVRTMRALSPTTQARLVRLVVGKMNGFRGVWQTLRHHSCAAKVSLVQPVPWS